MTRCFVEGNHSLLYRQREGDKFFGVLTGKPQLGGRNWKDGMCSPDLRDIRPATQEDFDYFRVCSKGYL